MFENGWRADTPYNDTLFRAFALDWVYVFETLAKGAGGKFVRTEGFAAADLMRPNPFFNNASLLRHPPTRDDLNAIDEFFKDGAGETWMGTQIGVDLTHRGWTLKDTPPFMVCLSPPRLPECPPGVEVRPMRTGKDVRALEQMWIEGFPFPNREDFRPNDLFTDALLDASRIKTWFAFVNDERAAAVTAIVGDVVNTILVVVTRPQYQGRGIASYMTSLAATANPDVPAALIASDDGRRAYERLGFVSMFRVANWARQR